MKGTTARPITADTVFETAPTVLDNTDLAALTRMSPLLAREDSICSRRSSGTRSAYVLFHPSMVSRAPANRSGTLSTNSVASLNVGGTMRAMAPAATAMAAT